MITLVAAAGFGSILSIRRGSSYSPCTPGVLPTDASPCELGAMAVDPDGVASDQGGNGSSALNLTTQVVVCPPDTCLSRGCSPVTLRRHFFVAKGLQGCGIDTMAPEGSQFQVS